MNLTSDSKILISGSSDGNVKIFDTANLRLLESINVPDKDISCLAFSADERFFSFVNEKNTVFIYSMSTFEQLQTIVFGEDKNVTAINFINNEEKENVFICVKDHGVFFLEEDNFYVDEEGRNLANELKPTRAFQTFEFNKEENYIITIDSQSLVYVWNLEDVFNKNKKSLPISKYRFKTLYESFYLKPSNKMVLTVNKNGHSFYAYQDPKRLELTRVQFYKYKKANLNQIERSHTISFNHAYTIISVNNERLGEYINEEQKYDCEIFIYADQLSNELLLKKHIFKEYMGLKFNTNIFVITPNPKYDDIFLTGDSNGRIIMWDLASMHILNIYKESCDHISLPAMENPILEIVFKSNGNEFYVSTCYGAISYYSNLGNHDIIMAEHDEQFMTTDFHDGEGIIPQLCNSRGEKYKICNSNEEKGISNFMINKMKRIEEKASFQARRHKNSVAEFVEFMKAQRGAFESELGFGEKEIKDKLEAEFYAEMLTKSIKKEEEPEKELDLFREERSDDSSINETKQIRHKKNKFKSERLNKTFLNTDTNLQYIESDMSDYESDVFRRRRNTRRQKKNEFYLSSDSEDESKLSSKKKAERSLKKQFAKKERSSIQKPEEIVIRATREYNRNRRSQICTLCGAENATYSCLHCTIKLDIYCGERYLVNKAKKNSTCFNCYFINRNREFNNNISKNPDRMFMNECNREFIDIVTPIEKIPNGPFIFHPQIGEQYYFIPEAFLCFIHKYKRIVKPDSFIDNINRIFDIKQDILVEVMDYQYHFPFINFKYEMQKIKQSDQNELFIIMELELKIVSRIEDIEFTEGSVFKCSFTISPDPDALFLIPKHIYQHCSQKMRKNNISESVLYDEKAFLIKSISKNRRTLYNSIELTSLESGVRTKNNTNKDDDRTVHPYFLFYTNTHSLPERNVLFDNNALYDHLKKRSRVLKKFWLFQSYVDVELYIRYPCTVEIQMNIELITERARNGYYYDTAQLEKDIKAIGENAVKFNQPESDVCRDAEELEQVLLNIMKQIGNSETSNLSKRGVRQISRDEEQGVMTRKRRKLY